MIEAVSILFSVAMIILFAATVYGALSQHRGAGPILAVMLVLFIILGLTS